MECLGGGTYLSTNERMGMGGIYVLDQINRSRGRSGQRTTSDKHASSAEGIRHPDINARKRQFSSWLLPDKLERTDSSSRSSSPKLQVNPSH